MISKISNRRTFEALRKGRRARDGFLSVAYIPLDVNEIQLGFAFTRKFGNAVERNRARRRLRPAFSDACCVELADRVELADKAHLTNNSFVPVGGFVPAGGAFLVSGSRQTLSAPYADLVERLGRCVRSTGVIHKAEMQT